MTIDLQSFCAKDDIHSYMLEPFVIDGFTYATNRHIVVRVPGGEARPDQSLPDRTVAAVRKLFATEHTDFQSLPEIPEPETCPDCEGTGRIEEGECPDCGGLGEFTHGNHDYECKECDGTGEVHSVDCSNRDCNDGVLFQPMQIGAAKFQVCYLFLISKLPNARISVPNDRDAAAFTFDGGEGRLMPCRES